MTYASIVKLGGGGGGQRGKGEREREREREGGREGGEREGEREGREEEGEGERGRESERGGGRVREGEGERERGRESERGGGREGGRVGWRERDGRECVSVASKVHRSALIGIAYFWPCIKLWALRVLDDAAMVQLRRPEKGLLEDSAEVLVLVHGNTTVLTA